ncbi:hypothetical protein IMSHALPRED_006950 [Imshaugia aleurites]|uniref:Uncharacterized protein n=1 Tax=Imshaugia aleurites TaxID=172621 RepID=A0A8H3IFR7_9LECA|nr:hypothetical protein IMSHALPRED_006950 [Imshaugia aleurites]
MSTMEPDDVPNQVFEKGPSPGFTLETVLRLLGLSVLLKLYDPPNIRTRKDLDFGSGGQLVRIGTGLHILPDSRRL